MFCGALNRIIRKKSKLVCKLLLSEELDGGRLLLRLVPSSVCGLLRKDARVENTTANSRSKAQGSLGEMKLCL